MTRIASSLLFLFLTLLPAVGLCGEEIVVQAVGDIMLAGRWTPQLRQNGYEAPFRHITAELARGDINLANLEAPIATGGTEFSGKKFRFRAEPAVAPALRAAGINLVTLANNHSMDFGGSALAETCGHLDKAGIARIGAGADVSAARQAVIMTVKGKKIAFLGYSLTQPVEFFAGVQRPGTAPGYEKFVAADIAKVRPLADYVIVSFHWGTEGSGTVRAYQRTAARKAIDAGADVIIGHHPHVLQGIERYGRGIIFYSLGNFTFASKSKTAETGLMVRLRLTDGRREAELLPLDVLHRRVGFQPAVLSGPPADKAVAVLSRLSRTMNTEILKRDQRHVIPF